MEMVAAFIGYFITLYVAFYSVDKTAESSKESVRETFKEQRKLDKERQQEIIQGVLEAIYLELYVISHNLYSQLAEDTWKNFDDKKERFYNSYMKIPEDHLVIFRSNANIIGQVNNAELRFKIVNTYMYLQSLLDRYRTNNRLLDQHLELGHKDPTLHAKIIIQLEQSAPRLKQERENFREMLNDLFGALAKEWSPTSTSGSAKDST